MKVLERAKTPDGVDIKLEDWSDSHVGEYCIGAYPIAQRTGKYGWVEGGRKFRHSIYTNEYKEYFHDDLVRDFEALKSGEKRLEDLAEYFWNGQKDMWYLGMNVPNNDY